MRAHAQKCPHVDKRELEKALNPAGTSTGTARPDENGISRGTSFTSHTPLSATQATSTGPSSPPSSPTPIPPSKRARTSPSDAAAPNQASHGTTSSCSSHTWTAERNHELAQDLCRVFLMCNIPWNAIDNTEMILFLQKYLPGATIPERRKLSGTYLDTAVTRAQALTRARVQGKLGTGSSDGWKDIVKTPVIASMMAVDREVRSFADCCSSMQVY